MTAVVGMSNSLNMALAIKFLIHLKTLHKNYNTLQFQILCQLLIGTSVPEQEIQLPSPYPASPEEHGGSGLCWNAWQGQDGAHASRWRVQQQWDVPTWSAWFPGAAHLWMTSWDEFSPPQGTLVEEVLEKAAQSWVSVLPQEAIHWLLERNMHFVRAKSLIFLPCVQICGP